MSHNIFSSVPAIFFAGALGLLGACFSGDKGDTVGPIDGGGPSDVITHSLELVVDAEAVAAGEAVAWVATIYGSDGTETPALASLSSDLEPKLVWDTSTLSPTVAGVHVVTASIDLGAETLSAEASLGVVAADAATLDLVLDPGSIVAGTSAGWSVAAWDVHGNVADAADVSLVTDLTVSGDRLTTVVAGSWPVAAHLGDASDEESLEVLADVPDSLALTLTPATAEVGSTVVASVTQADQYGNPTAEAWELAAWSTDGGMVTVVAPSVTFDTGGHYIVRAEVPKTSAADEVEVMVDSKGPVFKIEEPDRGEFTFGDELVAMGIVTDDVSGVASLTINGDPVTVAVDGSFSSTLALDFGLNIYESEAIDGDGNSTTDTRAGLAGSYKTMGDVATDGLMVHLKEGAGGLDVLEDMAEELVSATDLDALIPSPAYTAEDHSSTWFGDFTWYSVWLYVQNPSFGSVEVDIDPTAGGYLDVTFTIHDLSLDWNAYGEISEVDYDTDGTITATAIAVTMKVYMGVSGGVVSASVADVAATTSGFDFDMGGTLGSVLGFFGVESLIEDEIEDALKDALVSEVETEVPALLEDALGSLEISDTLTVADTLLQVDAYLTKLSIDDVGISLSLGTSVTADAWVSPYAGPGSLFYDYGAPDLTGAGMGLGIGLDFLNQITHAAWGGGVLDLSMDGAEMGLDESTAAMLFPGVTTVALDTEALLPPVFVPGTTVDWDYDLQIGDLYMLLWDEDTGTTLVEIYTSIIAPAHVEISSVGDLEINMDAPTVWVDVVSSEGSLLSDAALEALVETALPSALSSLTGTLAEVSLPSIDGFQIIGITASSGGAEGGFVALEGSLSEAP
jgi:hypothetical protein